MSRSSTGWRRNAQVQPPESDLRRDQRHIHLRSAPDEEGDAVGHSVSRAWSISLGGVLGAAALGAGWALLAGSWTDPDSAPHSVAQKVESGIPEGLELDPLTSTPAATWVDRDETFAVVTWGSGSCPPVAVAVKVRHPRSDRRDVRAFTQRPLHRRHGSHHTPIRGALEPRLARSPSGSATPTGTRCRLSPSIDVHHRFGPDINFEAPT